MSPVSSAPPGPPDWDEVELDDPLIQLDLDHPPAPSPLFAQPSRTDSSPSTSSSSTDPHDPSIPDPIPGIIPACGISLLAGASGTGKTAFLSAFARDLAHGKPLFGRQPSPIPKVAWVNSDRSFRRSSYLWFLAADYPDIPYYCLQDDTSFDKSSLRNKFNRTKILRHCFDRLDLPRGSVVFVDVLALFLGGNLLDYDTCMVACSEIRAHCQELGITVIGTAHASKQKADPKSRYLRLQDRIAGSTALFGYTDTQMYLASPEEVGAQHYAFLWHPHHAPAQTFELIRNEHGLFQPATPLDLLSASDGQTALLSLIPPPHQPDLPWIKMAALATHAQTQLGMSRATVERYVVSLEEKGLVKKMGRGKYVQVGMQ